MRGPGVTRLGYGECADCTIDTLCGDHTRDRELAASYARAASELTGAAAGSVWRGLRDALLAYEGDHALSAEEEAAFARVRAVLGESR